MDYILALLGLLIVTCTVLPVAGIFLPGYIADGNAFGFSANEPAWFRISGEMLTISFCIMCCCLIGYLVFIPVNCRYGYSKSNRGMLYIIMAGTILADVFTTVPLSLMGENFGSYGWTWTSPLNVKIQIQAFCCVATIFNSFAIIAICLLLIKKFSQPAIVPSPVKPKPRVPISKTIEKLKACIRRMKTRIEKFYSKMKFHFVKETQLKQEYLEKLQPAVRQP